MFQHINSILLEFRNCFKREKTWHWFVILILGFMIRSGKRGITQVISALRLRPELYHTMLHYFRSNAYTTDALYKKWIQVANDNNPFTKVAGRIVLLGDHIKIAKEGRRMPGIQILHQDSQNSGKGEYIEGHIHAHVSAVISGSGVSRSLPLMTQRQQSPLKNEDTKKPDGETLITQMVNLIGKVVSFMQGNDKVVAVLDAYFAKASAFLAADNVLTADGERRLEIITRGRDDSVGYTAPPPRLKGQRGRSRKYGNAIKLWNLFADMKLFTKATLTLYGKPTDVKYRTLDLTWKPLGRVIRFVVAQSCRGKMILMCSDLTIQPEDIITMYCLRFKIETSFDEQKNDNGCFSYRFWTAALPKRKRWAKNCVAAAIGSPSSVEDANRAIESFLCLGVIATGIMTIIAFSHNRQIWGRYSGWIRTLRSVIPSIAVVKDVFAQDFHAFLKAFPMCELACIVDDKISTDIFLFLDVA